MSKFVAVTACIAGVAHTYMAAQNLKKYAKKNGDQIKVETQGAMGFENKLSAKDIAEADAVIFAVDTNVREKERFDGKKIVKMGTSEVVKDGSKAIEKAHEIIDN
ncbi:PTS fructose transporter subunit IIB [Lactobacillus sp. M0403]|uniref:PTS fructose transporter subunit IIB n=1 Tax=Lactobacillus TaxID=1578 RepID=UPI000EFB94F5|nr:MULTISPECIES: PTS fructose transporter subunit IIB [Lactobacillus]MBC6360477.1 PTS fructose transporter subunit IIB [Lactobacillus apis]MBH9984966.1 PTS fructose transporter subunit IIB [Lactobacillus sp. M0390]MBI0093358.1 PTS fructose transporter subunit IIB [Lactobacillus sp. M0403]MCO6528907.1 PTS fructose transporter subunit IIB [Lactobacillus sp.]RMC49847.1 PTS fructose transporter subunit IIB [Lactobacillus sp. ESL0263]